MQTLAERQTARQQCPCCKGSGIVTYETAHPYGNTVAIETSETYCTCDAGSKLESEENARNEEFEEMEFGRLCLESDNFDKELEEMGVNP